MSDIRRIYVEKKDAFAVEAKGLLADLKNNLLMDGLEKVRVLARYDVTACGYGYGRTGSCS